MYFSATENIINLFNKGLLITQQMFCKTAQLVSNKMTQNCKNSYE